MIPPSRGQREPLLKKPWVKWTAGSVRYLFLAACLLASSYGGAEPAQDFRLWGNITAITSLGALDPRLERFHWWMEGQGRFRDSGEVLDQGILRTGLGYALTDRTSAWIGYAYIPSLPQVGETLDEHRLWQQLAWSGSTFLGDLTSRTRLEQRFLEETNETAWRLRELIRLAWPVLRPFPLSLVLWNEVFVHLNSPAIGSGFDQNRAFAGYGYSLTKHVRAEIGYLNQFIATEPDDRLNHILSLSLFLNF